MRPWPGRWNPHFGGATLAGIDPLAHLTSRLRRELDADRLSVAVVDPARETFRIVACDGASLLAPGTELPLSTSTQVAAAAHGDAFAASDFRCQPGWSQPMDELMLALGFRSGCSLRVAVSPRLRAVVSLSSTAPRRDYGRRLERLRRLGPSLAAAVAPARGGPAPVLVLADDPVVAEGLASIVERSTGRAPVVAATLAEALAVVRDGPALVLADARFDGFGLPVVADALRAARPDLRLVAVPAAGGRAARRAAELAGADACAPRSEGLPALLTALARLSADAVPGDGPTLTRRELDVLQALDAGLRFKAVAGRLGIAETTAKWHARSAFRKLGASSRAEAVLAARRLGLLR